MTEQETGERVEPSGDEGIRVVDPDARYAASEWTPKQFGRFLLCGERPEPVPSYTGLVEDPEEGKIGIACSGGGIRSAAFGLGALQTLQDKEVLERARYLAGVSGGSYIAAAFCMVRQTWQPGKPKPDKLVRGWDDSNPDEIPRHPPFFRGSPEEQYLRNRSSYLAPGLFGKVQLGYRLFLGLFVNLAFIGLAVAALAMLLGLLYGLLYPSLVVHIVHGRCERPPGSGSRVLCGLLPLHIPDLLWMVVVAVAGLALALGAISILFYRLRAFVALVLEVWSLRLLCLAALAGSLLIGLPVLLSLFRAWGTAIRETTHNATITSTPGGTSAATAVAAGAGGVVTLGSAIMLQLRADWLEAKRLAQDAGKVRQWLGKLSPLARRLIANLIAGLLGPALLLALLLEVMSLELNHPRAGTRLAIAGVSVAVFVIVYLLVDTTSWSLHSFYRRRLCCAFALKRLSRNDPDPPPRSHPQAADGDPAPPPPPNAPAAGGHFEYPPIATQDAGRAAERNYRRLVTLSDTAIPPVGGRQQWPTLLVCAAANVSDMAATPPGRGVTSFTFSASSMGGPLVGAVKTREFEEVLDRHRMSYFSLPAAVAMSGAALSPSMGKMTRAPLRFLLTLANLRLGVWVPNPRRLQTFRASHDSKLRPYPRPRPSYLLREVLGMNRVNAPYLYVTDGGHYENLGVVELLRRGCTEIYCFDASNDNFDAIGDAVALARSELNVELEVDYRELEADDQTKLAKTDCVEGFITYPGRTERSAKLYYSRLVMTDDVPADVAAYHHRDERFPHDPTTDQLYTDQRFEAYRALGAKAAETALKRRNPPAVDHGAGVDRNGDRPGRQPGTGGALVLVATTEPHHRRRRWLWRRA